MKAVRFERYGGPEVLEVVDVPDPTADAGKVVVRVKAAGINPGEAAIRGGALRELFPAHFPEGQGSDFAGEVTATGDGVQDVAVGDHVIGFSDERSSHAEFVAVDASQVTPKPPELAWPVAGSLYVAGATAVAAIEAIEPQEGETVVVSGAAGGVGSIAVQLARLRGARVIGLASEPNHDWLRQHGVIGVEYGDGVEQRVAAAAGAEPPDAFLDNFGDGYIELALELGIAKDRINSIADFPGVQRHGVKAQGNRHAGNAATLGRLAALIAAGDLEIPIAATYPLIDVRAAFEAVERRHTHGKIVLIP